MLLTPIGGWKTMEWNRVIYIDCMDEKEGLPSLPDKSVDLCITDPPWNIGYKGSVGSSGEKTKSNAHYKDDYDNEWNLIWFKEIERICDRIILAPGRQNLGFWYKNTNPLDIFIHYKKNGAYGSRIAMFNNFDPYLYYGKGKSYWRANVFDIPTTSGFLQNKKLNHPAPKTFELWFRIIKGIDPKSVIDPFIGSGTTAEVCTKLGIPWIGYEVNEAYSQDINKRLKNCKREPKQKKLF